MANFSVQDYSVQDVFANIQPRETFLLKNDVSGELGNVIYTRTDGIIRIGRQACNCSTPNKNPHRAPSYWRLPDNQIVYRQRRAND